MPCLLFPHPSDNLVTASLLDSPARSSSNPNFPGYLCVSCWHLLQCWHPSSKFPSWRPPLAPICLSLTSSVPSFPEHASCLGVRPHPLSPAYSSLSNLSPNTKWHGPQMDWGLNYASYKGSPTGQTNPAKDLWHTGVSMERKEKFKHGGEMLDGVDTSSGLEYHTASVSQRKLDPWP